ncbi:sister chromatid cohesion 1 protein 2-like isoform X2 [Tasmannia lanceolata]|uniref:sister chromatid cohesion 1 protein 2-like isoform X2 n=1 Tax=Tasmannia lanceolata TaxID=3420 RepID=UPI004062AFF7
MLNKNDNEKEQQMFYSHSLLSKKGTLGTIWFAAHCYRKLRKDQIAKTNISSSIDKIMLAEFPIAFRLLGHLLIGVVRIYSKKVEYLYHDCNEALIRIRNSFTSGKISLSKQARWAPYFSITLPENFELDAFDLEDLEDGQGSNIKPSEQITLKEVWTGEASWRSSHGEMWYDRGGSTVYRESSSTGFTLAEEVFSPFPMDIDLEISDLHNISGLEASMEKLQDNQPPPEKCLDHENFCWEVESLDLSEHSDDLGNHGEQIKLQDMTPPDIGRSHVPTGGYLDTTIPAGTPEKSDFTYASVANIPEFMVIPTPTIKEQERMPRKRKWSFDETTILSNEKLRQGLHDASGLVKKRMKAPHTALDACKSYRISNLCQIFSEPLILCRSLLLKALFTNEHFIAPACTNLDDAGYEIPSTSSDHQALIDPSTPVASSEAPTTSKPKEVRFEQSIESEEELSALDFLDIELNLINENCPAIEVSLVAGKSSHPLLILAGFRRSCLSPLMEEVSSNEGSHDQNRWSTRTRAVANYLHNNFIGGKEQKQKGMLSLTRVLEGNTRTKCARLFYETLVLKSEGFIYIKQESPYGEILLLPTPQTEFYCSNESTGICTPCRKPH